MGLCSSQTIQEELFITNEIQEELLDNQYRYY